MNGTIDVLVVGAGVSGTAAAAAAARSGARTLLVDQEQYLGGTGYAGMFQYICGLYLHAETLPAETLNTGIAREIAESLLKASPGRGVKKIGQVYVLPYNRDELQSTLAALCEAEKNLTILRGTAASAVEAREGRITCVTLDGPDARQKLGASMIVDATGSGLIAAMAGAEFELSDPDKRQLAGFVFQVRGLKAADAPLGLLVPYHLARAVEQGIFAPHVKYTTFTPGDSAGEGYCKMSIVGEDGPIRDGRAGSDAVKIHEYLSSVIPAFKGTILVGTSLKALDREGRRITGMYTLTKDDVLSARKFSDGVVKNSWPIELWDPEKGTVFRYVPRGDYYEIPFRCLQVKGIGNLLTAGRCISVTREALGSTRVMGTCLSIGEQAGKAAAYMVKNGKYPEKIKEQ